MRLLSPLSFSLLLSFPLSIFAQQSGQDCQTALSVCSPRVHIEEPSRDYGWVVESDGSCLGFENNSLWFRLRVSRDGTLCFHLQPTVETDNYDWALYDVTGRSCNELSDRPDWLVSCNVGEATECKGETGMSDSLRCGKAFFPCIPVRQNQEFLLRVEAQPEVKGGFALDFSASTVDLVPPVDVPYIDAPQPCYGTAPLLRVNPEEGGEVRWFAEPDDAEPFFTGNDYVAPPMVQPATWYLETANARGCEAGRYPLTLFPHPEQSAWIERSDSIVEYPNPVISFSVGGTVNGLQYAWDLGDGTRSTLSTPVYAYPYPGGYTVKLRLTDVNGCVYHLETQVEILPLRDIFIPTAFSPNGDGKNDIWSVIAYLPRQFEVGVYTRFGKRVYQSNNPTFQWDGRGPEGKGVPGGTYLYRISYLDFVGNRQNKAGVLTVIR